MDLATNLGLLSRASFPGLAAAGLPRSLTLQPLSRLSFS